MTPGAKQFARKSRLSIRKLGKADGVMAIDMRRKL
jgi:hypothetical protein